MSERCPAQQEIDGVLHRCSQRFNHDGVAEARVGEETWHKCVDGMTWTDTLVELRE